MILLFKILTHVVKLIGIRFLQAAEGLLETIEGLLETIDGLLQVGDWTDDGLLQAVDGLLQLLNGAAVAAAGWGGARLSTDAWRKSVLTWNPAYRQKAHEQHRNVVGVPHGGNERLPYFIVFIIAFKLPNINFFSSKHHL